MSDGQHCPHCGRPSLLTCAPYLCLECAHGPTPVLPLAPGEPAWMIVGGGLTHAIGPWRREEEATSFRDHAIPTARVLPLAEYLAELEAAIP